MNSSILTTAPNHASNTTDEAPVESNFNPFNFSISYIVGVTVYAVIVFIVSVAGNSLVIYIVYKREHMRNSTNILIANMAVGDILMACVFPYVLKWLYVGLQWFDTIVGTILSFAMPLVVVTTVRYKHGQYQCYEYGWPSKKAKQNYVLSFFLGTYLIPLIIIAVAYTLIAIKLCKRQLPGVQTLEYQKKAHETTKKAIIMLVTVVVVFAVCWLPLQAREIMLIYFPEETAKLFNSDEVVIFFTWIGVLNSAINPCLYIIFSENFRREFGRILCCCMKRYQPETYLGIPASRATPMTTPLMSRRITTSTPLTTPLTSRRSPPGPNERETLPLRNLTVKH
ncbi:prolactin-releasing peptide receptor-like isoform X2 [Porites lutea]|uniref:prolactin-releasing peptide receptor-like isoform X2 n=1 Tax=Porites lutea TaxID=51062 RepID=UPI003CC6B6B0